MSSYKPPHDPPRWWERAITHSPLVILALWSVVVGVQVGVDPFFPRQLFSIALGHQPPAVAVVMGLVMVAGSLTALAGVLTGMQNRSRAWAIERYGWWMSSAAWSAYAVAVTFVYPGSTISWGSALIVGPVVGLARIATLHLIERASIRLRDSATGETGVVPEVPTSD